MTTWVNPWFPHEPLPSGGAWRIALALRRERGLAFARVTSVSDDCVKDLEA
jgi:hypothetical protein